MKNKRGPARESSPPSSRTAAPAAPRSVNPEELQRLKDELRAVNQRLSKIGGVTRPGTPAAQRQQLPEKQDLLAQKIDLERKIRAISRSA